MWEFVLAPAVDHGKVRSASTLYYLKMGNEDMGSDLPIVLEFFVSVHSLAEPSLLTFIKVIFLINCEIFLYYFEILKLWARKQAGDWSYACSHHLVFSS